MVRDADVCLSVCPQSMSACLVDKGIASTGDAAHACLVDLDRRGGDQQLPAELPARPSRERSESSALGNHRLKCRDSDH